MSIDKDAIISGAVELIAQDGHQVASRLAKKFGLSRQVANGYLQSLVKDGQVEAEGSTRARVYRLTTLSEHREWFAREDLQEDRVWRNMIVPRLIGLPGNVVDIFQYGATEMINNAIEHSGAAKVTVAVRRNALFSEISVEDNGEGIFLKIQKALSLVDPRESIMELAKGKLTTAPENHTGQGIFFTSRMMDAFEIVSGNLHFRHEQKSVDVIAERDAATPGTLVVMRLANRSTRDAKDVFDDFSDPEDYSFDKTEVPIRLAQQDNEKLVSRSQARRLVFRFERFKRVTLDFEGVTDIGQAFADELFRVFANAHPDVRLVPINTTRNVADMIRRAVGAARSAQ